MEGVDFLQVLVPVHQTAWYHFPKDRDFDEVFVLDKQIESVSWAFLFSVV